jgi:hypothetical protein
MSESFHNFDSNLPTRYDLTRGASETGDSAQARAGGAGVPRDGGLSWYNAKLPAAQENQGFQPSEGFRVDRETGEIIPEKKKATVREVRLQRFALQSVVRRILPKSRTAKCLRLRQGEGSKWNTKDIQVWRSQDHQSAHYSGLQTCGSVWSCPVCAAKISERRRAEVLSAMDQHQKNGGAVLMLTLTNPHTLTDDLSAMVNAQGKAMDRFKGARATKAIFAAMGHVGNIRAWEVTFGQNGWHPHFHILLFVDSGLNLEDFRFAFWEAWSNACRLAGLPQPSLAHGVRLDDGNAASEYISKGMWGLDREITKGHIKKARKGFTPFDLLRLYLAEDGDWAAERFREYAEVFKGKNQLLWSKGLKSLFDVVERSDEETAAQIEETAVLLGQIEIEQWRLVLKFDVRGELLELARAGGWEPVARLLDSLTSRVTQNQKRYPT